MKTEKKRLYYETLFDQYPDVLDTKTIRVMLGGVGLCTVMKLLSEGHLKYIHYREQRYLVPKEWLIEYVMSKHYSTFSKTLKTRV